MAVRIAESHGRVHRENERRAAEETARVAADHLSARAGRHPAARRVGLVLPSDWDGRGARGEAYVKFVNEKLGANHAVQIVSECGHNARCVYTTDTVLPVIFPAVR